MSVPDSLGNQLGNIYFSYFIFTSGCACVRLAVLLVVEGVPQQVSPEVLLWDGPPGEDHGGEGHVGAGDVGRSADRNCGTAEGLRHLRVLCVCVCVWGGGDKVNLPNQSVKRYRDGSEIV